MGDGEPPVRRGLPRASSPTPRDTIPETSAQPGVPATAPISGRAGLPRAGLSRDVAPETAPASLAPEPSSAGPGETARRWGRFTPRQWIGAGSIILFLVAALGLLAVLGVRWLMGTTWFEDFLTTYPGEYHLPVGAPVGLPPWIGWQHFFNAFLMVLIIRSGLQVRREKRPTVFWTSRRQGARKISLGLWFHQSLDLLWMVNGVVFVVVLFATGQWVRIVPTSWEVFPNAVSALAQYVSLDWPTENGWVNYNSLQQLAYFTTVFVAAPLSAVTGIRMSGLWPRKAARLSAVYPIEWARRVHFPVMLYFVVFIALHVTLVLATGALRNLNHMYASQDAVNWTGFAIFGASVVVMIAAWIAARPLVLAPIARLFGSVGR